MASVFVLLEAFNRKEAAALGFFSLQQPLFLRPLKKPHIGSFNANLDATSKRFNCSKSENIHTLLTTAGLCP